MNWAWPPRDGVTLQLCTPVAEFPPRAQHTLRLITLPERGPDVAVRYGYSCTLVHSRRPAPLLDSSSCSSCKGVRTPCQKCCSVLGDVCTCGAEMGKASGFGSVLLDRDYDLLYSDWQERSGCTCSLETL